MTTQATMDRHFTEVSSVYREVRTTDPDPVAYIARTLAGRDGIRGADIGCGDGRYDVLMFEAIPGLHLACVDANAAMLERAADLLSSRGIDEFETRRAVAEEVALESDAYDFIASFNAVHHFDLGAFLGACRAALAPGAHLFIYTRLPEQNARTIWGRHFPGFTERETRLSSLGDLHGSIERTEGLGFEGAISFRYPRRASLDRLIEQARRRHYSTFSLYEPKEFEDALADFRVRVSAAAPDVDAIVWHDENVLIHARRDHD
jgi:SAM-dependent methyltransferase